MVRPASAQIRRYSPVVTGRKERVARNESSARQINEGIEEAQRDLRSKAFVRMLCECGRDECDRVIAITTSEYETVRSSSLRFAVVGEHVIGDVERVVEETDRFVVVEKREGTSAAVADDEDPRS
jgi:malonyl CoA-acyl carrier protein transacylase